MRITRIGTGPIIGPATSLSIGENIQGPSMIRVPDWLANPLGRYYLYFADHKGAYIRMAFADAIEGPWTVHEPGSLRLSDSTMLTDAPAGTPEQMERIESGYRRVFGEENFFPHLLLDATTPHIASPDVHVDHERREILMYFHGLTDLAVQETKLATSTNGLDFTAAAAVLGRPYMRAFEHDGVTHALTMPGVFSRSIDGRTDFEQGPQLFVPAMRHSAVLVRDGVLHVLWSRVGDAPESILYTTIELTDDWNEWVESDATLVLRPEFDWEGVDAPVEPSVRSVAFGSVHQLRDPAIFTELVDDTERSYLLYAVAGESGIALAEIDWA